MSTATQVRHPAKFTGPVLDLMAATIRANTDPGQHLNIVDPFAGIGGVHSLCDPDRLGYNHHTLGIEIEPEWARQHERNICYDSTKLLQVVDEESVDVICSSPAYGNRMADQYDGRDGSRRHTYRIDLGRDLSERNGASLQWGARYQDLHRAVWGECEAALKPGGLVVLNVKDHIRARQRQSVAAWHAETWIALGLRLVSVDQIDTGGIRHGANHEARLAEQVWTFRKPSQEGA